jgi:hypothetical protein
VQPFPKRGMQESEDLGRVGEGELDRERVCICGCGGESKRKSWDC